MGPAALARLNVIVSHCRSSSLGVRPLLRQGRYLQRWCRVSPRFWRSLRPVVSAQRRAAAHAHTLLLKQRSAESCCRGRVLFWHTAVPRPAHRIVRTHCWCFGAISLGNFPDFAQMHVGGLGSGHLGGSATSSGRGHSSQQLHSYAQLACQFVG